MMQRVVRSLRPLVVFGSSEIADNLICICVYYSDRYLQVIYSVHLCALDEE